MNLIKMFIIVLFLLSGTNSQGQESFTPEFKIDPYVGFFPADVISSTGEIFKPGNSKTVGIPVVLGLRGELRFHDRVGLRIDANYMNIGYSQMRQSSVTVYDESTMETTTITTESEYRRNSEKIRAMLGFNFYFSSSENSDFYVTLAAGYRYVDRSETYLGVRSNYTDNIGFIIPMPVTVRLSFGFRSYFTERFGVVGEFGFGGGPILQIGGAIKF